jgi:hypothetical protein
MKTFAFWIFSAACAFFLVTQAVDPQLTALLSR